MLASSLCAWALLCISIVSGTVLAATGHPMPIWLQTVIGVLVGHASAAGAAAAVAGRQPAPPSGGG